MATHITHYNYENEKQYLSLKHSENEYLILRIGILNDISQTYQSQCVKERQKEKFKLIDNSNS